MKKSFMILGAAMLALATVGCQNDVIDEGNTPITPEESAELVLHANLPATRTTLDKDFKVTWNKYDALAVFNAPAGTEGYSDNLKFNIDANAEGNFSPAKDVDVTFEDDVNYDWYVCSPYRSELLAPDGIKNESKNPGYFPIGKNTQKGYNNSDHIASMDIMVGKALDTRTPSVTLKHLAVLHKFTVTNKSALPFVIKKLTIDGGNENYLFGTFRVNLTAENPALDPDNANGKYTSRELVVNEGTELAFGESADFYMVTAPFTLSAGETFKVTIETSTGTQTIEKTADIDIEFTAGTYNTARLNCEFADHLYSDTFNGTFNGSDKVTSSNTTFTPARWDTYDKGGMTVYDGVISNVNYVHDENSTLSRQAAAVIVGMDDLFVWFKAGGVLTVSGIKLYGKTDLNLSFLQTYKSSGITTEYSVDGGANWTQIGVSEHPAGNTVATYSYDFTVPAGSETISLRFTASTSTPRMDNVKLTWQAE